MSTPHCRRKHRHKSKPNISLMQSLEEIKKALDSFNSQSEKEDFLDFVESTLTKWRVHRPKC